MNELTRYASLLAEIKRRIQSCLLYTSRCV